MKAFAALSVLMFLAACGGSSEEYNYSFEFNGCKTGEHKFNSLAELCTGLQSSSLNNSCALSLREDHFVSKSCPGNFTVQD